MPEHQITLAPVNQQNWKACSELALADHQRSFVPSNLYSIAEAQFYSDATPMAIYNEADQLIGFLMYGRDVDTGTWKLFRLMIDAAFQGQGYGARAMTALIAEIAAKPDGYELLVCYQQPNTVARNLYRRFGFIEQSTDEDGKVTALLNMTTQKSD